MLCRHLLSRKAADTLAAIAVLALLGNLGTSASATLPTDDDPPYVMIDTLDDLWGLDDGTVVRFQFALKGPHRQEDPGKYVFNDVAYRKFVGSVSIVIEGKAADRMDKLGFDNRLVWQALRGRNAQIVGKLRKKPVTDAGTGRIIRTDYVISTGSIADIEVLPKEDRKIEVKLPQGQ